MKIAPRAIEAFIGKPDPIYRAVLLYGPDTGLARERARRLKTWVLAGSDDPFALVELTEATLLSDSAKLMDEIQSIGLLSSKRCIVIRDAGDKLLSVLKDVSAAFHQDVLVIVVAEDLSARSSLRAWFEATDNVAAVPCYRDEIRDIQQLIGKHFQEAKKNLPREVVDYLASQLGNDREVTRSELNKILIYMGDSPALLLEEAEALVGYNRDTQLDALVNAVADKDLRALDAQLSVHFRDGVMPIVYVRALLRYFNRLYYIKARVQAGYEIEATIANLKPKVFYKQMPLLTRHARNWSLEHIIKALKLLTAAEIAAKTSDIPAVSASSRRLFQVAQMRSA